MYKIMQKTLYILWDASHIWGLMALHAVSSMGLTVRLIKAQHIAQGILTHEPPAILLVPGGAARLKYAALGAKGCAAIRDYVASGGHYMGFCGGAGFALSHTEGLGLCPWTRGTYSERLQHLVSGHVLSRLAPHVHVPACGLYSLPVWWPGFFALQDNEDVQVLATYEKPDTDLFLADIELSSLPESTLQQWKDMFGVNMGTEFLRGQPCVLTGAYGKGTYLISYAHLETPHSPDANGWLAFLCQSMTGIVCTQYTVPEWHVGKLSPRWPRTPYTQSLYDLYHGMQHIMSLGMQHHILFKRRPWLYGWRTGIIGGALNNIYTSICTALAQAPSEETWHFWEYGQHSLCDKFSEKVLCFVQGVESYLLAERLITTLAVPLPNVVSRKLLVSQREQLFGKPMLGGGLFQELINITDELVFLQNSRHDT